MNYVIITPAKNESVYIEKTLYSIVQQTLRPAEWIIVDDGSTDNTAELVERFALMYPWIRLMRRETGGEARSGGGKVVRAFLQGYAGLKTKEYDFIVKLDADLELPADYFIRAAAMFEKYPEVGICGGYCVIPEGSGWVRETTAPMHIRGAFKTIRRKAFEEIGGFMPVMGWDGIDQIKLLSRGWKIGLIDSPVKHFRPTGTASAAKELFIKLGESRFLCGYDFFLTGLAAGKTAVRRGNIHIIKWILKGYFQALLRKQARHLSKSEVRFLLKIQYKRIFSEKNVLKKYSYSEG